ncbi:MAG: hypothetical protein M1834_008205 [Cirrosporium novae-zelandiae]|nr:MAG: hypothetical protein M1834_008205 [Cirrosporium novae-zelandiae]
MISNHIPASPQFTIAVIGGGIAGLSLTIGLLRQGVSVHVYEAADSFSEIGAGVSFGPNSTRAMSLIDPAIKVGYDKCATINGFEDKAPTWFDFRLGMPWRGGKEKGGLNPGHMIQGVVAGNVGQSSVHRAHFLDEMVKLIPSDRASFGKRLQEIEEIKGGVRMKFQDGTTAEASAVIGCDGIKSRTREILLGEETPAVHATFSGKYAYRGLLPMGKAVELLGEELAKNSQMYLGYHGHVLTFPIEKGETMNVVAFRTKEDDWEDDRWVKPMQREDMFHDFRGWGESVRSILSLMEKPDVWALFNDPPTEKYCQRRICLLGDAAHASTPHQGAGAGMALEDVYIMSSLLGAIQDPSDIDAAFKAYDKIRRPRAEKLVSTSRACGELYEFEHYGIGDDLEKLAENLRTRYDWIWKEDLEKQQETAIVILKVDAKGPIQPK